MAKKKSCAIRSPLLTFKRLKKNTHDALGIKLENDYPQRRIETSVRLELVYRTQYH